MRFSMSPSISLELPPTGRPREANGPVGGHAGTPEGSQRSLPQKLLSAEGSDTMNEGAKRGGSGDPPPKAHLLAFASPGPAARRARCVRLVLNCGDPSVRGGSDSHQALQSAPNPSSGHPREVDEPVEGTRRGPKAPAKPPLRRILTVLVAGSQHRRCQTGFDPVIPPRKAQVIAF